MVLAWENLQEFFVMLLFICRCSSFTFAFRHHPSPFRGLLPAFYTHFILSAHSWRFHFQPFRYLLTASATVLSGHFWSTGVFYLTLILNIFGTSCFYQGLPGSRQFFLEVCRASYWSLKHIPGPSVCLIHSNLQSFIHLKFVFVHANIAKVLLLVKTLIKNFFPKILFFPKFSLWKYYFLPGSI